MQLTWGFVQAGLDVQTSAVCIAVLWFGLDGILLCIWLLTCTFISLLGFSSGLDKQQCPACTKPCSLYVTLKEHPTHIQTPMTLPPDPTQFLAHCKAHKTPTQSQPCQELKMPTHNPPHPSGRNSYRLTNIQISIKSLFSRPTIAHR